MDRVYNEDRLSAYFDGELPSNERSEMEDRLRESADLRRALADFQLQRQSIAALASPRLPSGFADRVMERVLAAAAASAPLTPPPFPVRTKARNYPTLIAAVLSIGAMIALTAFLTRNYVNQPAGGAGPVVAVSGDKPIIDKEEKKIPDSPINHGSGESAIASNANKTNSDPSAIASANPTESTPKDNAAGPGEKVIEPIASDPSNNKAIASANVPSTGSNSALVGSTPKAYAAATTKVRPKAYRAQIGTRSEFDARLKEAGVSVYYGKPIEAQSTIPRAQPVELLPDPEYVIVEGSETQLKGLVEKIGAQADLMLHEPKGDLEAEMLIEALCKMDAAAQPLRPSEAKEGEVAAFTIPAKAIFALVPVNVPTGEKPGVLTDSSKPGEPNLTPRVPPKSSSGDESSLYVPRVIFILDVRMGETEGGSSKK